MILFRCKFLTRCWHTKNCLKDWNGFLLIKHNNVFIYILLTIEHPVSLKTPWQVTLFAWYCQYLSSLEAISWLPNLLEEESLNRFSGLIGYNRAFIGVRKPYILRPLMGLEFKPVVWDLWVNVNDYFPNRWCVIMEEIWWYML